MSLFHMNHYHWLERHLPNVFENIGINWDMHGGIIRAHGDKCHSFRSTWDEINIPFPHGVAIYLLTYCRPFCDEVRETENGWVDAKQWVVDNYERFKPYLPEVRERLDDWLPLNFMLEFGRTKAAKLRDKEIVREHDGRDVPWPGKHKNVVMWVELEDGHAVGFNETPSRGWAFPTIKLKRGDSNGVK